MVATPNIVILNDNVRRQNALLDKLTEWLELTYLQTQTEEAEKTPKRLRPYTINVVAPTQGTVGSGTPGPIPVQIMPRNFARHDVAVSNFGPGDILWCNTWFDPASILQQMSDPAHPNAFLPAPNQLVEIGLLTANQSMDITSTDALWVWNNGTNALLTLMESVFARATEGGKAGMPMPGWDGIRGGGYDVVPNRDGEPMLMKGLR